MEGHYFPTLSGQWEKNSMSIEDLSLSRPLGNVKVLTLPYIGDSQSPVTMTACGNHLALLSTFVFCLPLPVQNEEVRNSKGSTWDLMRLPALEHAHFQHSIFLG